MAQWMIETAVRCFCDMDVFTDTKSGREASWDSLVYGVIASFGLRCGRCCPHAWLFVTHRKVSLIHVLGQIDEFLAGCARWRDELIAH